MCEITMASLGVLIRQLVSPFIGIFISEDKMTLLLIEKSEFSK